MASSYRRHILVVPWIVDGHVNSMLRFAHLLAAHQGLLVTFGCPARAYALAQKRSMISRLPHSLHVQVIEDGLPLEEDQSPTLYQAQISHTIMQPSIEALLQQHLANSKAMPCVGGGGDDVYGDNKSSLPIHSSQWPPISCIISDTFLPSTRDLADKFDIPRVEFWTCNATIYDMFLYLSEIIAKGHLPLPEGTGDNWTVEAPLIDFLPGLPPFHITELPRELLQASDVSDPRFQFIIKTFACARDADRILVHSVYELESHVYDGMQSQGIPIYAVGPLYLALESLSDPASKHTECLQWLDQQVPGSVVYVSFGTIAKLTLQEMHSMALGLEDVGHPFLWVVRNDNLTTANVCESLPEGFMERTVSKGKGFIMPWAPQREVLKHIAVGVFLSHCGWNSILESLWEGVPVVACPRIADQRTNAKFIVDWKVGVEVERHQDGSFTKEDVQKAIQAVLTDYPQAKEKALHLQQVCRGSIAHGSSHSNIVNFVKQYLLELPIPKCISPTV